MLSIALVLAMAAPAFAWHPEVTVLSNCLPSGEYELTWPVSNPSADWNTDHHRMVMESDTRGVFDPGTQFTLGETKSPTEVVPGTTAGEITNTYTVYWIDLNEVRPAGKDYTKIHRQTKTTDPIVLGGDCTVPEHVPAASATANSGCNTSVTLTTGDGNVKTLVELIPSGSSAPLFSEELDANQTRQVDVPLEYGKSVDVQLLQDGKPVNTITVERSSNETCNPTTVTGNVAASACNTSSSVEAWTTRFEVVSASGATVDVSYNWTAEGHTFDGQVGTYGVGEHFADINTPDWATPGMQLLLSVDFVVHGSSEFPEPILQQPITKGNCKATPANPQPHQPTGQQPSTPTPVDTSLPVTGGELKHGLYGLGAVIVGAFCIVMTRKRRGEELTAA